MKSTIFRTRRHPALCLFVFFHRTRPKLDDYETREKRGKNTHLAGGFALLRFRLARAVEVDDCARGGVDRGGGRDGDSVRERT